MLFCGCLPAIGLFRLRCFVAALWLCLGGYLCWLVVYVCGCGCLYCGLFYFVFDWICCLVISICLLVGCMFGLLLISIVCLFVFVS